MRPPRLAVARPAILARGLAHRCPNCGAAWCFGPPLTFRQARACRQCGFAFDAGGAFFLGSVTINYTATVFGVLLPLGLLVACGGLAGEAAVAVIVAAAVLVPLALYQSSRSWWLMIYCFVLPWELPANRKGRLQEPGPGS